MENSYTQDVFNFNNSLDEINKIETQDIFCDPTILDTLTKAASQNAEVLKPAAELLKKWETESGFYISLLNIFVTHSIDVNARWLAIVCCKNGVDKYWRKSATCAINMQERKLFKERILSNIKEPIPQLAVQMAVVIAKIARYDYPCDWAELFPQLLKGVQSADNLCQDRTLLVFYHVIKSLSSKRLAGDRFAFNQLVFNLLPHVKEIWTGHVNNFSQASNIQQASSSLEKALLCLKILKKFDIAVNNKMNRGKAEEIKEIVNAVILQIKPFLEARNRFIGFQQLNFLLDKYIILLVKFIRDILELHPESFVEYIAPTFEHCIGPCFIPETEHLIFEKFIIYAFNIFKSILLSEEYQIKKSRNHTDRNTDDDFPIAKMAIRIKEEYINPHVQQICSFLITKHFILNENDLVQWEENPEEFAAEEDGDSWSFSLRPATEKLFVSLLKSYKGIVVPMIIEMLKGVGHITDNSSLHEILLKEAVYNAVGLSAMELYDEIEFDNWLLTTLIPESKYANNSFKYVKRRIVSMMGQWVGIRVSRGNYTYMYQIALDMMTPENNLIIRIAAAKTLGYTIDDFEFEIEVFLPYLESAIFSLFQLITEVVECDTKLTVLNAFNILLQRVNVHIRPYSELMVKLVPELWRSSSEHNLFQASILITITYLLESLGSMGQPFNEFVISVIKIATDVNSPFIVYLLEDALIMWRALINNSPSGSPSLLEVISCLFNVAEYNLENLRMCFQILQHNFILMPNEFISAYGQSSLELCLSLYNDLKSEGKIVILKLAESVIKLYPEEGTRLFMPLLALASNDILDLADEESFAPVNLQTNILTIISRVISTQWGVFKDLIQAFAIKNNCEGGKIFDKLIELLVDKIQLATPFEKKKTLAIALCTILPKNIPLTVNVNDIIYGIIETINDTWDAYGIDLNESLICLQREPDQLDEDANHHDIRMKEIVKNDPINQAHIKDVFILNVKEWRKVIGDESYFKMVNSLDKMNKELFIKNELI